MSDTKWSRKVKERDGYICKKCGMEIKNTTLESHHIIRRKGKSKISDGITLCRWCHYTAKMGFKSFKSWLENSEDSCQSIINFAKKSNNKDVQKFLEKISYKELKFFLGILSKYMKKYDRIRCEEGRINKKRVKGLLRKKRKIHSKIEYLKNNGMTSEEIANTLNEENIKTLKNRKWTSDNIRTFESRINIKKRTDYEKRRSGKTNPRSKVQSDRGDDNKEIRSQ